MGIRKVTFNKKKQKRHRESEDTIFPDNNFSFFVTEDLHKEVRKRRWEKGRKYSLDLPGNQLLLLVIIPIDTLTSYGFSKIV